MPLKHACFISYRHGQYHLMKRFISDLDEALSSELEAYFPPQAVIFKDTERLATGEYLDERIARAICESACLIAVYTPSYLHPEHPYCAREFRAMEQLEQRRFEAVSTKSDKSGSLIIPIVYRGWNSVPEELRTFGALAA